MIFKHLFWFAEVFDAFGYMLGEGHPRLELQDNLRLDSKGYADST